MKKLISFALPVYNEQESLPLFYATLIEAIEPLKACYEFEIIFVNDGSRDNSWNIIQQLAKQDACVRGLNFSRNFGQQMALTAAYDYAQGDAVISLDTDLQDPPAIIPAMLEAWEQGARIVYARRTERADGFLKKWTAELYYRLMARIAEIDIPRQVAHFRLIDRVVLNIISQSREQTRFLRGIIAWTGFPSVYVDFKRPERILGQTKYSWKKLLKLAFDGIICFSSSTIVLPLYFGLFFMLMAPVLWLWSNATIAPALFCVGMGLQFFVLWLLGEYIVRMYDQLRGRPLYVVAQEIGHPAQKQKYRMPSNEQHERMV